MLKNIIQKNIQRYIQKSIQNIDSSKIYIKKRHNNSTNKYIKTKSLRKIK